MSDGLSSTEPSINDLIDESSHVGGIFSMEYDQCSMLVNDYWTREAGGLPRHSLLLARPMVQAVDPKETAADADEWTIPGMGEDEESDEDSPVIGDPNHAMLLRVKGPAELPTETRLKTNRHDAIRQTVTSQNGSKPSEEDVADLLTRREMQYSGVTADVLGTFYYDTPEEDEPDVDELLRYGSDIQNVFSAGNYIVYKLQGEALSWIGSYPSHRGDIHVELGDVKYTSTQIWDTGDDRPSVSIPIKDFIGTKTALFGMTRTGKSNAMKILATAIETAEKQVGQLLFDPSGEYAYANDQDEKALADLGDATTIYKFGAEPTEEDVKPLRANLLDPENIEVARLRVEQVLADEESNYLKNFRSFQPPTVKDIVDADPSEVERTRREHFAYLALLAKQLDLPDSWEPSHLGDRGYHWLGVPNEMVQYINEEHDAGIPEPGTNDLPMTADTLVDFWEAVAEDIDEFNQEYREQRDRDKDWVDEDLRKVLQMFDTSGQSGHRLLSQLEKFHNADSEIDAAGEIYEDLENGQIVVVDISNGAADIVEAETTRIAKAILNRSMARFQDPEEDDDDLPNIQLYLEEAHQHFDKDQFRNSEEQNPYVQLAKEGAKFRIGLTYATQEVTDIDPRVLSNTANWIITHLNSKNEISELAQYYNFEDFEDSIRNVEDVGFARVKTNSGEYIVPTKISLFDRKWIQSNTPFLAEEGSEAEADREAATVEAED